MKNFLENLIFVNFLIKSLIDKVRDHRHLTGKNGGPAHNTCIVNFTQKKSNFNPFIFHNFSNYGCHLFCKKLVDKKE